MRVYICCLACELWFWKKRREKKQTKKILLFHRSRCIAWINSDSFCHHRFTAKHKALRHICVIICEILSNLFSHLSAFNRNRIYSTVTLDCNYVPSHFICYGCFNDNFRLVHNTGCNNQFYFFSLSLSFSDFSLSFSSFVDFFAFPQEYLNKLNMQCESGHKLMIRNRIIFALAVNDIAL